MKIMKRLALACLCICLAVPCVSAFVYAASGKIMFTDPETKVGETVEVKGVVQADAGTVGDVTVNMSYDTSMLQFASGDGVTETARGKLSFTGTGNSARLEYFLQFQVLKEGSTKITVDAVDAKTGDGETLECALGTSTLTIAAGNGTETSTKVTSGSDAQVEVNGMTYTVAATIPKDQIPTGYTEGTIQYAGQTISVVNGSSNGLTLAYLLDASNTGDFFLYQAEDATFVPFEQLSISDATTIALLTSGAPSLPEQYVSTTITVSEKEFPAWQDSKDSNGYLLYAINQAGERGFYRLDAKEGTYQRVQIENTDEKSTGNFSLGSLLDGSMKFVTFAVIGLVMILLLIVVIMAVKLYNRNAELDEIYDQYGIDWDEETEKYVKVSGSRPANKKEMRELEEKAAEKEEMDDDEDFDDDLDDDKSFDEFSMDFIDLDD